MRFVSLFFLVTLLLPGLLMAQNDVMKPTLVAKAVYFDVSPPMSEMTPIPSSVIDMTWKDGVVKNMLSVPKNRNKVQKPAGLVDPALQTSKAIYAPTPPILSIEGIGNVNNVMPPDTDGDVGPNHYFQMINLSYAIWDKSGNQIYGPVNNSTLWQGFPGPWAGTNDGDPIVLYDQFSDRWIASQFALPNYPNGPFYELVAVSTTGNPMGSYYRYAFQFSDMPDYPKLGVWSDGYYMTCNRFTAGSTNYTGTGVAAFEKSKMLTGDPSAQMVYFTTTAYQNPWSFVPADADGTTPPPTGAPALFSYYDEGFPDRVVLYSMAVNWTTPASSTFGSLISLPVDPFTANVSGIPQPGTTKKLEPINDRLMYKMQYRNFVTHQSMVASHTVDANGAAGIRWYEFRNTGTTWSVYQQGTFSPDNHYRWMGSIAMDGAGNIAIGYSVSSSTVYPSVRYAGRLAGDPLGQMTIPEEIIVTGGGNQTSSWGGNVRWGDYSAMSVDPADDATFWYTQEYAQVSGGQNWHTRIGTFSFASILTANATATPQDVCLGSSTQLNANATGGSGTYTYSWTSDPAGFTSNIADPIDTPTENTLYFVTVDDGTNNITDSVDVEVILAPTAFAGNDTIVCWYVIEVPLHGTATNQSEVLWTTNGDGSFSAPASLITSYLPGSDDRQNGGATLTLMASNGPVCNQQASDDLYLTIDACTGMDENQSQTIVQVYPNPGNGNFMVTTMQDNLRVSVTNMQGKEVYKAQTADNTAGKLMMIDLTGKPAGIYMLKAIGSNGTQVLKLIVQ
ncbi:MAG: T9SS type A sorting domain-containing protein [Bacteroidetes bacterium]|nr:T9SS type A sorting domain-containing protein [Bacteroidota bacterium]